MSEMKDALVIGAGPAGASCALWLERLGFSCLLAEARGHAGGLLNDSPYRNDWIVTQPGVTGIDLSEGIGLSLAAAGVPMLLGARARKAERFGDGFRVTFDLPNDRVREIDAARLVIATGVQPRSGPFRASERVIIGPGHRAATYDYAGKSVAILGGGDNAFENHGFVKRAGAREVHIYARTVRASGVFAAQVPEADISTGPFEADHEDVRVNGRIYDVILVMFGWEPASFFETGFTLDRNPAGFFLTDFQTCETSAPGVFAIGEVTAGRHPCVVTAMSDGIAAAKAIQRQLERAALPG